MPLQIRRGPTADRLASTPLVGELVYDTTTGSVYVGNGAAAGGLPVTNFSVGDARSTTAKLFLGDSLNDNTVHSGVTFAYVGDRLQATVQQDLSNYIGLIVADQGFQGNLVGDDSGIIVASDTHTIYGNFVPQGNIVPDTNIAYDLGTSAYRFRDLYLSGSSIYLGNAVITSTGTAINFPLGSTVGGQALGINEGDTYNITISGNVIGTDSTVLVNTATGQINGDLYGSVFGFDSSILVDARDGVLRGTLIGSVQGNVTGDVTGNASSATVASTIALTETNTSAAAHYVTFVDTATGNEQVRTDTGLTYFPSTNTLSASIFSGNVTGNVTGSVTGNIFTSLIDSADSSAITVTPAMIFNSDVTLENELFVGGDVFPITSESYNLGSYTKKFNKLYLTEGANALWIGNATISGNGTVINLPAGSTVGGSAIGTSAGANAITVTTNVTSTNASHFITFFEDQTGDNAIYTDSGLTYNPFSNTLSATNAVIGTVTGNLTGTVTGNLIGSVSGSVIGDVKGSIFADNSTLLVDATAGQIPAAVVKGTFEGDVVGNVTGNLVGNTTGFHTGNVSGAVVGDVKGSIFADNSTLLVDATSGEIPAAVVKGTFEGDVVGSVFADNSTKLIDAVESKVVGNVENISTNTEEYTGNTMVLSGTTTSGTKAGLRIDTDGNLNDAYDLLTINGANAGADGQAVQFVRSRGTLTAPEALQSGDSGTSLIWYGRDSTAASVPMATMQVTVSGAPSANLVPTELSFSVFNSSFVPQTALSFGPDLILKVNSSTSVAAGGASGQVNLGGGVVGYLKVKIGATTYAMPYYGLNA